MSLVSIGVPVYNGAKYLEECLNSIQTQTYQKWECVIIDNCSKDDTNKIASQYINKDKRFRLIRNVDFVDQTTNWNISFSNINPEAKYFKIVCADDWIFPDHIEKMVELMEKYPNAGICSSYRIDGNRVNCDGLDYYNGVIYAGKEILIDQLLGKNDYTGSVNTVLFRIDSLKKVINYPKIFKPGTYHIDTELAYEVLSFSDFSFVFQVLSYTRRHNETYTSQISNRFKTFYYFSEKELYKYLELDPCLKKEYKEIRHQYAIFLIKCYLSRDKDCINWHKKYLDKSRLFTPIEFLKAVLVLVGRKLRLINFSEKAC